MKNKKRMGILILTLVLFCTIFSSIGYAYSGEFDDYIESCKGAKNIVFLPKKEGVPVQEDIIPEVKRFTIKFNKAVNASSARPYIELWQEVDGEFQITLSSVESDFNDNKAIVFRPDYLEKNSRYLLIIKEGIKSKSGESLKGKVLWEFTTEK